jgi:hypothetical protein
VEYLIVQVILTSLQILATDRVLRYCLTMMTISLVLVEIIIFFFIWKYNDGIYNKMFLMHSLTERYQVIWKKRKTLNPQFIYLLVFLSILFALGAISKLQQIAQKVTVFQFHI